MSNISDIAKMLRSSSHTKPGDGSNINVSNKRTRVVDLSASKGRKNTYLQGFSGKTEILFVNGAKFTYASLYIQRKTLKWTDALRLF